MYPGEYRAICFEEHGDECLLCPSSDRIVAHHVDGDRDNNAPENIIPLCWSCHRSIHCGAEGYEKWSEQLPVSSRTDLPRSKPKDGDGTRPNIDISYGTHGDVKDFANDRDISLTEAYEQLLNAGLESLGH